MKRHLLLVDFENVPKIDLSALDESYRAIVFVGAAQNPPRAAKNKNTAHRFSRVDFQKISGSGKNALDFHIAFHLGRMFETSPETTCIVVSRDKGFDPLLSHVNSTGLCCRRIESFEELAMSSGPSLNVTPVSSILECRWCRKSNTIEHHGGRWCSNCGSFASPPDPKLLPSNQPGYREPTPAPRGEPDSGLVCAWCHQPTDMSDGIYDDGEWMCGGCVAQYAH